MGAETLYKNYSNVPQAVSFVDNKNPVKFNFGPKETPKDLQAEELNAANIPANTKKLIATEYMRLRGLHPKWKPSKAARKAGEKYNVKFDFK
jgi:hypothetical protein